MAEHILVVDDEKDIANLVAVYLKNEGFDVTTALTGKDALAHIDRTRFDLAVLDVMLPDTDGFKLCAYIREKYQYPIIMLTAKGEAQDKINGLATGADDYVTKPFCPSSSWQGSRLSFADTNVTMPLSIKILFCKIAGL